jgi:hypothetical protein
MVFPDVMTMRMEKNNNITRTKEADQEFGLQSGPWILWEWFESQPRAIM